MIRSFTTISIKSLRYESTSRPWACSFYLEAIFTTDPVADSGKVVINETAAKKLGFLTPQDAIGSHRAAVGGTSRCHWLF